MSDLIQHDYSEDSVLSKTRLWIALLPALLAPLLAALFYWILFPGTWFGRACYVGIKIHYILWPLIGTLFILRESMHRPSPSWKIRLHNLIPGALIGFGVVAIMFVLMKTPLGDIVHASGDRIRTKVEEIGMLEHYIAFSLFISLVNSFIEEYYWRWFAYGNIRRVMPLAWAHIVAALAFAAHHILVVSQFFPLGFALFIGTSVAVGGLIWSLIYQRYNTLLGPWICHIIIDAGFLWIVYDLFFRDL